MITVIGGTYREIDYDDIDMEIYGSGFRCVKFLLENKCPIDFHTTGNTETIDFLQENQKVYKNFQFKCTDYNELITFKYNFSIDHPTIYPNLQNILKSEPIRVDKKNIIAYGMLETDFEINGNKVVYDPQTSITPTKFNKIGKANELVYIVNKNEAQALSSSGNLDDIKHYFFEIEKVKAFIIKNGPYGATLFYNNKEIEIPAYITENVNKIGSGDIFTSSFGYYWMEKNLSIEESAINASKSTALYCDKKVYIDVTDAHIFKYRAFKSNNLAQKQIYLASPFFSLAELILVDKVRTAFMEFGVKVFSPFHDIGLGEDISIAKCDIEGIKNSDIIFCIFDGLDSGTLIESGYSLANNKKIIGYYRTCTDNKLLMLRPGNFKTYNHLTTAIYQTIWSI